MFFQDSALDQGAAKLLIAVNYCTELEKKLPIVQQSHKELSKPINFVFEKTYCCAW